MTDFRNKYSVLPDFFGHQTIEKAEAEAMIAAWITQERTALSVVRPKGA